MGHNEFALLATTFAELTATAKNQALATTRQDRRFGDACGPCCTAWCVHSATNALR
jgi:hypothetical protein